MHKNHLFFYNKACFRIFFSVDQVLGLNKRLKTMKKLHFLIFFKLAKSEY